MEPTFGTFDMAALQQALDTERQARGLSWNQLAAEINLPFQNNTSLPIAVSTLRTMQTKRSVTGGVVLQALRWLGRTPESFLSAQPIALSGSTNLPQAGRTGVLRIHTPGLHAALNEQRIAQGLTWTELARVIPGFTPGMLTNLATGPLIGFPRVMYLTQWLRRPLADFVRVRSR